MREPQKTRRSSLSFQPWRCVQSFFLRTEKQQQKSWTESYGWEPSLLEQIDMDVRGHNMCERMSLSRFKIKEFTFRTHARANIVVAQCWSSISQTYTNASTALEGMVKCQKFQSTRKMLLPAISRKLHGTQPSISSRLCWSWLLVASGIVSCSNFGTRYYQMAWFYISLFSNRPRVSTHWSNGSSKSSWFTGNVFNMFLHFESVIHMLHRLHTDNDCTAHAPEPKCPKPM